LTKWRQKHLFDETRRTTMACRNTADEPACGRQVWLISICNLPAGRQVLIIFCNLSAASRFGRANESTAKPADEFLLPVKRQAGSVVRHYKSPR